MPATPFLARVLTRLAAGRGDAAPAPPVRPAIRRTAPRALLWGVGTFVVLQLGLGLASELYPRIRDPFFGDKLVKLRRRLTDDRPPTVVMLGTSRTGLGFHGKVVESRLGADLGRPTVAFNYGIPASGPVTHLVYLRRLLDAGIVPDVLVLEILPAMLADLPDGGSPLEKNWFYGDRMKYAEQAVVVRHGFDAGKVRDRYWRSVLLPWYTLRFPLMSRISPSWVPVHLQTRWSQDADECGWGKMLVQEIPPGHRAKGLARAYGEYAPVLAQLTPGGPAADALRELLTLCRERGIAVRLVLMPESSEFRGWYPEAVRARLDRFLAGVAAESGLPPVTDARTWLADDRFTDGHHMLEAGAVAFSDRLAREVIAPALKERPGH